MSDWRLFEENFPIIEKFFETEDNDMLDKKIPFSHFSIRLIMSYSDKAFEHVEEKDSQTPSDPPPSKQYQRSLIFKKVSFDRLKILKHCMRVRVRFLLDVICNIEYIMN